MTPIWLIKDKVALEGVGNDKIIKGKGIMILLVYSRSGTFRHIPLVYLVTLLLCGYVIFQCICINLYMNEIKNVFKHQPI
jgi:hypothetical protein